MLADPLVEQVEQRLVVGDDDLGQEVDAAGGEHDVDDLLDRGELVGRRLHVALDRMRDHRLALHAELHADR